MKKRSASEVLGGILTAAFIVLLYFGELLNEIGLVGLLGVGALLYFAVTYWAEAEEKGKEIEKLKRQLRENEQGRRLSL